ncbi:YaiI/YqxD family protein [Anaeromicropila herbilytica]|uniref:UPF0178 protein bsdtb5_37230 n=1 Tax=Anaeromicropila herbilytica TaxID=2785025 RepID=A0A7R7EP67_9FIRM|nr:YaiI/YqxD family protein [Anaeromicropila herbilytica]BCN32428.1 UPF0178 protein [Anaeromicropila herbilytica]
MKILVDADACPVVSIIEKVAKEKSIPLVLFCDTSHIMTSNYAKVVTVDKGADAVDFVLISSLERGDVVVTQDYGVAAMALGKTEYVIHQNGRFYTNENIEQMLYERHMKKKLRRTSKFHGKGPKKRTKEDDQRFEASFRVLIERMLRED